MYSVIHIMISCFAQRINVMCATHVSSYFGLDSISNYDTCSRVKHGTRDKHSIGKSMALCESLGLAPHNFSGDSRGHEHTICLTIMRVACVLQRTNNGRYPYIVT